MLHAILGSCHGRLMKPLPCSLFWVLLVGLPSTIRPEAAGQLMSAAQLFERYEEGRFDEVAASLANVQDFRPFWTEVASQGTQWKPATKATYLLEAAAAAFRVQHTSTLNARFAYDRELGAAKGNLSQQADTVAWNLLEAACKSARELPSGTDFDRRWQLAALALYEGVTLPASGPMSTGPRVVDGKGLLRAHVDHVGARLDKGTALMAVALEFEQRAWARWNYELLALRGNRVAGHGAGEMQVLGNWEREVTFAVETLRAARDHPSVRIEATIRLGVMMAMQGRRDADALTLLREARSLTSDSWWLYLSYLIEGRLLEATGRVAEAENLFRSAMALRPGAQAATLAVAALSFLRGDAADAYRLTEEILTRPSEEMDPWALYPYGDFRLWADRLNAVRNLLR